MPPPPDNRSIYIHLGLPKTASTFVQHAVFPQLHGLHYIPKHGYSLAAAEKAGRDPILLTCEKDSQLLEELDHVHARLPHARIILVFRAPYSWLVSKYKYAIRKHTGMDFRSYLEALETGQGIAPGFYTEVIRKAKQLFPGNCLILKYEDLRTDPQGFVGRIEDFTDSTFEGRLSGRIVKPAFSDRKLVRLRRFNRFYPYTESRSTNRFFRFIHYKYREFLLHIVAFLSGLLPADIRSFQEELERMAPAVREAWKSDWQQVLRAAAAEKN